MDIKHLGSNARELNHEVVFQWLLAHCEMLGNVGLTVLQE